MKTLAQRIFAVHSSVGVATGLLLFAVTFTGTVALFQAEVGAWANPSLRFRAPERLDVDALLEAHDDVIPRDAKDILVFLPDAVRPSLRVSVHAEGEPKWLDIDPRTGARLPTGQHGFEKVWRNVHTNALMGRLGRYLVGLSGLVMLLSLVSGLLAHRKLFQQLWTWRRGRSFRIQCGDLHKLLGVWGSVAHVLFGFTGAILGLLGVLALVSAFVVYRGDREAAIEAVVGPAVERSGEPAEPPELGPLFREAARWDPDVDWQTARLMEWGDRNSHVELAGFPTNTVSMRRSLRFRGHDGAVVHEVDWVAGGPWHRAFGLVQPLHYGSYGGLGIKVLYVLLGVAGALLVATGLVVWLDGRSRRAGRWHRALAGSSAAVLAGFPLATFMLPLADRMWASHTAQRFELLTNAYVACLGVALLYGLCRPPERALRELLAASAGCALWAVALDILTVGWAKAVVDGGAAAAANFGFAAAGVLLAWVAVKLPPGVLKVPTSRSPDRSHSQSSPEEAVAQGAAASFGESPPAPRARRG
ncbi:MAG: PepSY-associated TM helix domain-containing protein [Myxococcota bacterium]